MVQVQIRDAVFETNSSSTHSVTIAPDEVRDMSLLSKAALESGVLEIHIDRDYGWGWERLYKPENKIAYLISQLSRGDAPEGDYHEDKAEAFMEAEDKIRILLESVERFTGCKVKVFVETDYFGVDHDSAGVGTDLIWYEEKLIDFLFSKESYIQLGNDNSPPGEYCPSDIGDKEMFLDNYGDVPENGEEITITVGMYSSEVEMKTKDGWKGRGYAKFDGSGEIADLLTNAAVTKATVHITQGTKNQYYFRDEDSKLMNSKKEQIIASRNELHRLVSHMSIRNDGNEKPEGLKIARDFEIKCKFEQDPSKDYWSTNNVVKMTVVASPDVVQKLKAHIEDMPKKAPERKW